VVPAAAACDLPPSTKTAPSAADADEEAVAAAVAAAGGLTRTSVAGLANLTPREVLRPMWELRLAPRGGGVPLPAFTTGDHVAVQPVAPEHAVDALCARLRWDPDYRFTVETTSGGSGGGGGGGGSSASSSVKLPAVLSGGRPVTVRALLRHVLDVSGEVSPHQLRALAGAAGNPAEADALRALCERGPFLERVRGGFATLGSLLAAFPSVHLPLDRALALLPPITPRYYSVSSAGDGAAGGGRLSGGSLDVTFRQMRAAVPPAGLGRGAAALTAPSPSSPPGNPVYFQGLASSYMASLREGDAVSVAVRPSSFRLPDDPAAPVVFIAGGIGVAPFRAFALHRLAQVRGALSADGAPQRLGPGLMLYGCRDADDEVYAGLWKACVAEGALTAVDVGHAAPLAGARAPARLADALVAAHADEVWQALSRPQGGVVYVCGGASGFGKAVAGAVRGIVASKGGISAPSELDAAMSRLLEGCRFVEDLAD
jgi:cytochrome P450 / NADPH-cytochrome P450 reductase